MLSLYGSRRRLRDTGIARGRVEFASAGRYVERSLSDGLRVGPWTSVDKFLFAVAFHRPDGFRRRRRIFCGPKSQGRAIIHCSDRDRGRSANVRSWGWETLGLVGAVGI